MSSAPSVDLSPSGGESPALDRINFREFKILLRAERFSDPRSFHDFWKIVKHAAGSLDVETVPLVGEFAYQIEFDSLDKLPKEPRELSEALYKALQLEGRDWIHMGNTKTALVYKLGNQPVHNDE